MFTDEYVALVTVNIPSRKFILTSEKGNQKVVSCETPDQFQAVLEIVRANHDHLEIAYDF